MLAGGADLERLRAELPLERPSATAARRNRLPRGGRLPEAETLFEEVLVRQPANDAGTDRPRRGAPRPLRLAGGRAGRAGIEPDSPPRRGGTPGEILFAHAAAADEPALRQALDAARRRGRARRPSAVHGLGRCDRGEGDRPLPAGGRGEGGGDRPRGAAARAGVRAFEQLARVCDAIAVPRGEWRELLARMYLRQGFLESAADEWIASINELPTARALLGLAEVAWRARCPRTRSLFAEHALRLDPEAAAATRLLATLRERQAA